MPEDNSPSQDKPEQKSDDSKPKKKGLPKDEPMTPEQKKKHEEGTQRALKKIQAKGKKKKRLPDDERRRLYRKAVVAKARKLKHFSEIIIMILLAVVIGIHALPFIKYESGNLEWKRSGLELAIDLVTPKTVLRYEDEFKSFYDPGQPKHEEETIGTYPHLVYLTSVETGEILVRNGQRVGRFDQERPATLLARLYLLVPFGAALLLLLYLIDYKLWMGRFLPALSFFYGFGMVGYLMATRLPALGTWNAFGSLMPWWVWLLLMVPLFLVGAFSMLRSIVSHRYKRYEFRGLPIPEHLDPNKKTADEGDEKPADEKPAAPDEKKDEKKDDEGEKAEE